MKYEIEYLNKCNKNAVQKIEAVENSLYGLLSHLKGLETELTKLLGKLDELKSTDNMGETASTNNSLSTKDRNTNNKSTNKDINKDREYNPFLTPGQIYNAHYSTKAPDGSYIRRTMSIEVINTDLCTIMDGSQIASSLTDSPRMSIDSRNTHNKIMAENKYIEDKWSITLLENVKNIRVSTAATLLCGKPSQARIFKHSETGDDYPITRKSNLKRSKYRSAAEQEKEAFEKFIADNK